MNTNIRIRNEAPEDVEGIARVTEDAFRGHPFSQGTEAAIIRELRAAGALTLSLVAELDGRVLGHIAFSPAEFSDGTPDWYTLGPVSVAPEQQRQGTGSALAEAGLARLRELGAGGCVLVGDPAFYARFGFRNHPECRMEGVPDEVLQFLAFGTHHATGRVTHHPAFHTTG